MTIRKFNENGVINPLIIIIILISSVLFFLLGSINEKNKSLSTKSSDKSENLSRTEYLRSKGLNVDPVAIKVLEFSKTWQDETNNAELHLKKAYLTPTLVENVTQCTSSLDKDKNVLVLEVDIRDLRIQGNQRDTKILNK